MIHDEKRTIAKHPSLRSREGVRVIQLMQKDQPPLPNALHLNFGKNGRALPVDFAIQPLAQRNDSGLSFETEDYSGVSAVSALSANSSLSLIEDNFIEHTFGIWPQRNHQQFQFTEFGVFNFIGMLD